MSTNDHAQWTWLVYMAGDNNLESAGRDDLAEMRSIGSSSDVKVLVQFDTEQDKTIADDFLRVTTMTEASVITEIR